tara:strand:- start:1422 stop:1757 length:336 start_codon:yes stop_codon:yes gene_type:complete
MKAIVILSYIIFISFILTSCNSSVSENTLIKEEVTIDEISKKDEIHNCIKGDVKIMTNGDMVKLNYYIEDKNLSKISAEKWCSDRKKIAFIDLDKCENECCYSIYRCKTLD